MTYPETCTAIESAQSQLTEMAHQRFAVVAELGKAQSRAAAANLELEQAQRDLSDTEAQLESLRTVHATRTAIVSRLERACGLGGCAPSSLPAVPRQTNAGSLMDQFNEIKDPAARSEFYRKHEDALHKENATLKREGRKK